jgi:hypothetical protein
VEMEGSAEQFHCEMPGVNCESKGVTRLILRGTVGESGIRIYNLVGTADQGSVVVESKISNPGRFRLKILNSEAARKLGFSELNFGEGAPASIDAPFVGFSQALYPERFRKVHVFPDFGGLKVKVETKPHYFCEQTIYRSYPDTIVQPRALGERCDFSSTFPTHSVVSSRPGVDSLTGNEWYFPNLELSDLSK